MNADVKALWLTALRSRQITTKTGAVRKFKQGYGKLCRVNDDGSDGMCCLGVLTELAVEAGVLPPGELRDTESYNGCYYEYDNGFGISTEVNVLPPAVMVWAELDDSNPSIECREAPNGDVSCLTSLNDVGETFDVIADVIEAEL